MIAQPDGTIDVEMDLPTSYVLWPGVWSPDATRIACAGSGSDSGLWIVEIDTGLARKVYAGGLMSSRVVWDSDGNSVLAVRGTNKPTTEVIRVEVSSGRVSAVFSPAALGHSLSIRVSWSADRQRMAFVKYVIHGGDERSEGIWIVERSSKIARQITRDPRDRLAELSPDGRYVAFIRYPKEAWIADIETDKSWRIFPVP